MVPAAQGVRAMKALDRVLEGERMVAEMAGMSVAGVEARDPLVPAG